MITVYRVVNRAGSGPFRSDNLELSMLLHDHIDMKQHIPPLFDFDSNKFDKYGGIPYVMHFGCPDMKILASWFGHADVIEALSDNEFFINEYRVSPDHATLSNSKMQIMFDIDQATVVKRHSVTTLCAYSPT